MKNGMFNHSFSVLIEAENHDKCNFAAARFRYLQKAWGHSVTFSEYKSARKGDVLKRELQFNHKDFPSNIIAFSESVRCIAGAYNTYRFASISVLEHGTIPANGYEYLID